MQRALVILAVFMLVTLALAAGALASNWPFWERAWQWQKSTDGWPDALPGPTQILRGGNAGLTLHFDADPALASITAGTDTRILLLAGIDGRGSAFFAPGYSEDSLLDGRGLAAGLQAPLYGILAARWFPGLLDSAGIQGIGRQADTRAGITPRQLLWQLSGYPADDFRPLDPFSARAQLASGPDFERAALRWKQTWPAGSHFEASPVNQQMLAVLAVRLTDIPYAQLLEQLLWSQMARADAIVLLDHPRGGMAAHCCLRATAGDWLRLGLLLADGGRIGDRQLLPAGFVDEMAMDSPVHPGQGLGYRVAEIPGVGQVFSLGTAGRLLLVAPASRRAVLWVGTGPFPNRLPQLLNAESVIGHDRSAVK
jgi:hypothetical protein